MTTPQAPFLQGSIFKHVVVMTLTGALGLMTLFLVDLADLYFLSLLENSSITAGIGFAGSLAFANLSLAIGAGIGAAALVARSVGAGQIGRAKQYASTGLVFSLLIAAVFAVLIDFFASEILGALGATGEAAHQAKLFVWTLSPAFVALAGTISTSFILRGMGDFRRAMYNTMTAAIITLILDPIFIFKFGWGIQGTAAANGIAYVFAFGQGLLSLIRNHQFLVMPSLADMRRDIAAIWAIAWPAIIAQLATPFAAAYMNYAMAPYGDAIVAAGTVVNRVVPVAFGMIFSLSGAVGPIIGQNFGAKNFARVKLALRDGLGFAVLYSAFMSIFLYLLRNQLIAAFHVTGRAAELVVFFTTWIAVTWAFTGGLFVANAAFNNLGKPIYSTWANWGRATLGTIPFAIVGAQLAGPEGIMVATAIGSSIFGMAAMVAAWYLVGGIEKKALQKIAAEGAPSAA